ncbi:MAG: DegT/DnrJ/EryC1/StrS family aminotransferase [Bacteroidales bacterium]
MAGYSAFKMGKLGKKSEAILIPDFTFFTSAEIFSMKRVIPFFVEADQSTFNIESIDLELKENTEKVCNLMIK